MTDESPLADFPWPLEAVLVVLALIWFAVAPLLRWEWPKKRKPEVVAPIRRFVENPNPWQRGLPSDPEGWEVYQGPNGSNWHREAISS